MSRKDSCPTWVFRHSHLNVKMMWLYMWRDSTYTFKGIIAHFPLKSPIIRGSFAKNDIWRNYITHIRRTGWRRLIGCLKLQVIFRKSASNYRALLRKMTYEDKASCDSTPLCIYLTWLLYMWRDSYICDMTRTYVMMRVWLTRHACGSWWPDKVDHGEHLIYMGHESWHTHMCDIITHTHMCDIICVSC